MKATKRVKKAQAAEQKSNAMAFWKMLDGQLDLRECGRLHEEMVALKSQGASRLKMSLDPDAKRFHVYDMEAEGSALRSFINSVREKHGRAVPEWLKRLALLEPTELAILGNEVTLDEVRYMCRYLWREEPAKAMEVWMKTLKAVREFDAAA